MNKLIYEILGYPREFMNADTGSYERTPHYTIETKKNKLDSKYRVAINYLKNKSSILKKNEEIMKKYSRSNIQKSEDNLKVRHSSKSSYHQTKNLKIKKGQYQRMAKGASHKTHYSSESASSLKKSSLKGGQKAKTKERQVSIGNQNERPQDNYVHKTQPKSIGSQLMNYTNKSKRLTTNTLTTKQNPKAKKRMNNSTS